MTASLQSMSDSEKQAFEKFQEATARVRGVLAASQLWERVFSAEERKRLGNDLDLAVKKHKHATGMWASVHGCNLTRAVIEVANKLNHLSAEDREWLLRESGELLDAEEAFEYATVNAELVLNSMARQVYWRGEPITIDWSHEAKWAFMWELAKHGKAGLPIDSMTLGDKKRKDYVSKTKSELANHDEFPIELADKIEVVGKGTQQLNVVPTQIRLFEQHTGAELREWLP